jgi:diacylglycerol kinase family enzyme
VTATGPIDIACVLNLSANCGKAGETRARLEDLFAVQGLTVKIANCDSGAQMEQFVRQAVAQGARMLVAAGGDGTVNAVAALAMRHRTSLGVLPLGTLNHFAKDNGIPLELKAAIANLAHGRVARIDVGEVNGHIFVNNSSIGLYPQIVRTREQAQARGAGKWQAFLSAALYVLGRYSRLHIAMAAPGRSIAITTPFVFIGNNRYEVAGVDAGSRKRLDEGILWVHGAPNAGRIRLLWLALKTLMGFASHREWHNFETGKLEIDVGRRTIRVSLDGEVRTLATPLRYLMLPGALELMVPDTSGEGP